MSGATKSGTVSEGSGSVSSGSSTAVIDVPNCEAWIALVKANGGVTVSFSGTGSCLDGVELFFPDVSTDPLSIEFEEQFVSLACNASNGVSVFVQGCGGGHDPPCCLSVPGPGSIDVVAINVYPGDFLGDRKFNEQMKGCAPTTDGFPYSMVMCTDQGGGGAPVKHVYTCLCLKATSGDVIGRITL